MPASIFFLQLGALCVFLVGCASNQHPVRSAAVTQISPVPGQANGTNARVSPQDQDARDLERLSLLWQERKQTGAPTDYPIGPGDILEISVPDMQEIVEKQVRVSGKGTIILPLIGTIPAKGLTEEELIEELRRRLRKYLQNPRVNLFVKESHNRQVAVVGAVAQPGLYDLTSEAKTILDMVSLAGGMTEKAAPRLLFVPAEPEEAGPGQNGPPVRPAQLTSHDPSGFLLSKTDPITIDIRSLTRGGNQLYLTLPARPGDVVIVPGSGDVLVDGWVETPGSYQISPGMTVRGAIAAAGGAKFAADTSAVKVIRQGKTGGPIFLSADLNKITQGEQADIPIQEGDVVAVAPSSAKLVPYGAYRFFATVFHVGFNMY